VRFRYEIQMLVSSRSPLKSCQVLPHDSMAFELISSNMKVQSDHLHLRDGSDRVRLAEKNVASEAPNDLRLLLNQCWLECLPGLIGCSSASIISCDEVVHCMCLRCPRSSLARGDGMYVKEYNQYENISTQFSMVEIARSETLPPQMPVRVLGGLSSVAD
jgi:hypothetical protein